MDYCPHTNDDIAQMQAAIGIASIDELFADIPQIFRLKRMLDIPTALSEQQTIAAMSDLARKNKLPQLTLTGAGAYHHFIPAVVGHIIGRAEFYTAYTPYQAEISQGILQAIYEYQTMIAHLTVTEIANASMHDGASAMAEAAVLCAKMSNRTKIKEKLKSCFDLPFDRGCMHECVFSGKKQVAESGVHTIDIAKRLIDFGYHPPDDLFPIDCTGSNYDRTDRNGKQGNARCLLQCHDCDCP